MKKSILVFSIVAISLLLFILLAMKSCIIQNPKPEECTVVQVTVTGISEGGVKDIVFENAENNIYYINRGLERGLHLDSLKTKVLNKTVTLHLSKVLIGTTSGHISQVTLDDEIIFTEFN